MARLPLNTVALNQSAFFAHEGEAAIVGSGNCVAYGHKKRDSDASISADALVSFTFVTIHHGSSAPIVVTGAVRAGATEQHAAFALFSGRVKVTGNPAEHLGKGDSVGNVSVVATPVRIKVLQSEEVTVDAVATVGVADSDILITRHGAAAIEGGGVVTPVQVKVNTIAFGEADIIASALLTDSALITQFSFTDNSESAGVNLAANASQYFASTAAAIASLAVVISDPLIKTTAFGNFVAGVVISGIGLVDKIANAVLVAAAGIVGTAIRKIILTSTQAITATGAIVSVATNNVTGFAIIQASGSIEFAPTQRHGASADLGITGSASVAAEGVATTTTVAAVTMLIAEEDRTVTVPYEDRTLRLPSSDTSLRIAA